MIQLAIPTEQEARVELVVGSIDFSPSWVLTFDPSGQVTRIAAVAPDGSISQAFKLIPDGDHEPC